MKIFILTTQLSRITCTCMHIHIEVPCVHVCSELFPPSCFEVGDAYVYNVYVTGSGKIQNFADSIKIEIFASIMSEQGFI